MDIPGMELSALKNLDDAIDKINVRMDRIAGVTRIGFDHRCQNVFASAAILAKYYSARKNDPDTTPDPEVAANRGRNRYRNRYRSF